MPRRSLNNMTDRLHSTNDNDTVTTQLVFADPVTYLAGLGLSSEIVAETALPAAA